MTVWRVVVWKRSGCHQASIWRYGTAVPVSQSEMDASCSPCSPCFQCIHLCLGWASIPSGDERNHWGRKESWNGESRTSGLGQKSQSL